MQTVRNGVFAEIEDFNPERAEMKLQELDVDHVEVFPGTQENIERRNKLIGKKYSPSTGFKKAPKIKKK